MEKEMGAFEDYMARENERIWAAQERFRMEVAATILAGIMANPNLGYFGDMPSMVTHSIKAADELIKQLDLKYN